MRQLESADESFLDTAPVRVRHTEVVDAPHAAVWEAVADPGAWPRWFEMVRQCRWTSPTTRRVGASRTIKLGPVTVDERFIRWEEGHTYAFCVTRASLPMVRRMVERATVTPLAHGVEVVWDSAVEPTRWVPRALVRRALRRGLARGFSGLEPYLQR